MRMFSIRDMTRGICSGPGPIIDPGYRGIVPTGSNRDTLKPGGILYRPGLCPAFLKLFARRYDYVYCKIEQIIRSIGTNN